MLEEGKYLEFQLNKISNGWVVRQAIGQDGDVKDLEVFQDSLEAAKDYLTSAVTKYLNDVNEED